MHVSHISDIFELTWRICLYDYIIYVHLLIKNLSCFLWLFNGILYKIFSSWDEQILKYRELLNIKLQFKK